jgi:hypothetical protein
MSRSLRAPISLSSGESILTQMQRRSKIPTSKVVTFADTTRMSESPRTTSYTKRVASRHLDTDYFAKCLAAESDRLIDVKDQLFEKAHAINLKITPKARAQFRLEKIAAYEQWSAIDGYINIINRSYNEYRYMKKRGTTKA